MSTVSHTSPSITTLSEYDETVDLVDLLITVKVISHELLKINLSPIERETVRFFVNHLLDLSLNIVAGKDEDNPPYSPKSIYDHPPF